MRTDRLWCAGILAAVGLATCVGSAAAQTATEGSAVLAAAPARVAPKDRNAAIKYLALFSQLTKSASVAGIDWDAIGGNLDPAKMPAEYKEAVKAVDPAQITRIREAAALQKCDFENRYEDGWAMLLPALGNFRQCVRLLRIDTREAIIAGDLDRAAANLVAGYQMVGHVSRDPIMICSLVGAAMAEYIHKETVVFINTPGVTREQKQRVADALRGLGDDPINVRASIEGERSMSLSWMRRKITDGDDAGRAAILEAIGLSSDMSSQSPEYLLLMNLGRDELLALLDLAELMYRELAVVWDTPDALDRLKAIEDKLTSGGYGLFAQLFGPAFFKVHKSTGLTELHLRQLVADLESRPVPAPPKGVAKPIGTGSTSK